MDRPERAHAGAMTTPIPPTAMHTIAFSRVYKLLLSNGKGTDVIRKHTKSCGSVLDARRFRL